MNISVLASKQWVSGGIPYLLVGATGAPQQDLAGSVYLYNLMARSQLHRLYGSLNEADEFGFSLESCAMTSGSDIMIGAPRAGSVWQIALADLLASGPAVNLQNQLSLGNAKRLQLGSGRFGEALACYNADDDAGLELAIGEPEGGTLSQGKVLVYDHDFATSIGQRTESQFKMRIGYRLHSLRIGANSYLAVAAKGDYNPFYGSQTSYLQIFAKKLAGSDNSLATPFQTLCDRNEFGECRSETSLGYELTSIPDITGDSIPDFIASAPRKERDQVVEYPRLVIYDGFRFSPIGTIAKLGGGQFGAALTHFRRENTDTLAIESAIAVGAITPGQLGRLFIYELP